ncbi:MAG: hypothetical protein K9N09_04870 [Candidatus Cloacimonetes bacterium]|nr:hypothetical protein [Candidatus Cloacimonadota bacterium]MCF7815150.1 hypothetical protein [Candidatus Cloacimonadota bacterium]MCF7868015.1 hypothetical protein [Candidatus Cloacimonadota bacterium]MCF7883473.1 hypothetical protein [Candidatus Cloacimonadota bacterium]
MKCKHKKWIPLAILFGIGAAFLFGWIVQLLWNATITQIFNVNSITYWQAVMLLILFKILFSSHYNVNKEKHKKVQHPQPEYIREKLEEEAEEESPERKV